MPQERDADDRQNKLLLAAWSTVRAKEREQQRIVTGVVIAAVVCLPSGLFMRMLGKTGWTERYRIALCL